MNGAELLVRRATRLGADVCFANPGTTEMQLLAALDATPGMRSVLGLFEGACTGAADGYARMTGRPALTLLHLGPGFANGIANLHNARRAFSPIVNLVGDHPQAHLPFDAPLTSDIESLARPVSKWVRTSSRADALGLDFEEAFAAAQGLPSGVATLIVPADCAWDTVEAAGAGDSALGPPKSPERGASVSIEAIEAAADQICAAKRGAILLGADALSTGALGWAGRIARSLGTTLFCDTFVARAERGAGIPSLERLPYFPEQIEARLAEFDHLIIIGTRVPVAFFGYRGGKSQPVPASCRVTHVSGAESAASEVLAMLAEQVSSRNGLRPLEPAPSPERPQPPRGELNVGTLGQALAAVQPEGAIVVDEAATSGAAYWSAAGGAPPHTYLGLTGGAIGQGIPCATGAALACRDRRVISLQADGSGLYTAQALWTQAREGLDVTTVICANQEYRILRMELARSGITQPGPQAEASISLTKPSVDWVSLSRGFGVPAVRVASAEDLVEQIRASLTQPGPSLIEALLA